MANCSFWKSSTGLLSGEAASKGQIVVACQRDLGQANPVYTAKQTNTWWVWTTSDAGSWDWFPETAVSQGAPDEPINGIAVCG